MFLQSGSTGSSAVVSANPARLTRFAAQAGTRTQGLEPAVADVGRAVAAWNAAPCDPRFAVRLAEPDDQVDTLSAQWVLGDQYIADVATAFIRADATDATSGPIRFVTQSALDQAMTARPGYNPIAALAKDDPGLWAKLTGGDRCWVGGGQYDGGGFVTGPDGVRYPLVIPSLPGPDGKRYNSDDGGPGDVDTLDGADPGWFTVRTYQGQGELTPVHDTGVVLNAAINGLLNTASGPSDLHASPSDYRGLVLGDGRPQWYPTDPDQGETDHEIDQPEDPSYTKATATVTALQFPINAVLTGADQHETDRDQHYGAYQLVLQRNVDGRVRAQLTQYEIVHDPENTDARVIVPVGISVNRHGVVQSSTIHYRPHPHVAEITPRETGEYHVFDHFEVADGFWDNPDYSVKFAYQDR